MPCKLAMSSDHQSGDAFGQSALLSYSSKLDKMGLTSEMLWLRDLYTATYLFLFFIVTSQTRHSVTDVMFTTCIAKLLVLNTNTTSLDDEQLDKNFDEPWMNLLL